MGTWIRLEVAEGGALQFSGCSALKESYNYALLRAGGREAETPVSAGVPFSIRIPVNVSSLSQDGPLYVASIIAQNYHPGDINYGGYPFQSGARAMLTTEGGALALRIVNG